MIQFKPRWTREPSLEDIQSLCRERLKVPAELAFVVGHHAVLPFDKVYLIAYGGKFRILKVSLPVYPSLRTLGEVATLRWIAKHTKIPVPNVIDFNNSNNNEIGFEWILMTHVDGISAHKEWRKMSMDQKSELTKRVAEFQAQLARDRPFKKIGTLGLENRSRRAEPSTGSLPEELVSIPFFMRSRVKYDVPRGPFRNSYDWFDSLLRLIILEQRDIIKTVEDPDDREDAEDVLKAAERLLSYLPEVFPKDQEEEFGTALYHWELTSHDIVLDKDGKFMTITGWDCASAMPLWMFTKVPKFLAGQPREDEPKRDDYSDETPQDVARRLELGHLDDLDNEGKNRLYWIHRREYEVTQLRKVYKARLMELWPDVPLEGSDRKLGFFEAVMQCSGGLTMDYVHDWLNKMQEGVVARWGDEI